jgi:hypothetical protein
MADPTQTAEVKADAKATADATVATDEQAVHGVQTMGKSPKALGSAAVGAGIGLVMAGPPGALVGAGVGWAIEKYRVAGGPVGKLWDKLAARFGKGAHAAAPPEATAPTSASSTK